MKLLSPRQTEALILATRPEGVRVGEVRGSTVHWLARVGLLALTRCSVHRRFSSRFRRLPKNGWIARLTVAGARELRRLQEYVLAACERLVAA